MHRYRLSASRKLGSLALEIPFALGAQLREDSQRILTDAGYVVRFLSTPPLIINT
jgi:hypothetical protein